MTISPAGVAVAMDVAAGVTAADVVAAYRMLAAAAHVELLIDRQGYIRAISRGDGRADAEPNALLAEVQELNAERVLAPAPEEHVH